jgi:hypothetical protein
VSTTASHEHLSEKKKTKRTIVSLRAADIDQNKSIKWKKHHIQSESSCLPLTTDKVSREKNIKFTENEVTS